MSPTGTILIGSLAVFLAGCGSADPTGSGGSGNVVFTTWGEEYIEQQIGPDEPAGENGFADGWTVRYQKFLINLGNVQVRSRSGDSAGGLTGTRVFDMTRPGIKSIFSLSDLPAQAWDDVSYEIAPATAASELGEGASEVDKELLVAGGYSVYLEASASKGSVTKTYRWGFDTATHYGGCHAEQNGDDQAGIVVTNGQTLDVQLTIHGDHPYYDRLQASADPAVSTRLRFDALAAADDAANADGEITLEELEAKVLDVTLYDPSGLGASNHRQFVSSLIRTIGHFRGEGECTISGVQ